MNSLSDSVLITILGVIDFYGYKNIFYVGHANEKLIVKIKEKKDCSIVLADWFDNTSKQAQFWWDEDDLGPIENCPKIPEWALDIPVQIEGIPEHDLLLIDIVIDSDYLTYIENYPKVIVLFGDAQKENIPFKDLYIWTDKDVLIGLLI